MVENIIEGDQYSITYDREAHVITFRGTMRLRSANDYAPVNVLLRSAHAAAGERRLTLDFRQLQFLNSSGINALCKFVISARDSGNVGVTVLGKADIYWQQRSLVNLTKFWPDVHVTFE